MNRLLTPRVVHVTAILLLIRLVHIITITSQPIARLFHKIQRPPKTDLPPNDGLHHVLGSIRRSRSDVLPTLRLETCRLPRGMSRIGSTRKQPRGITNYQFIAKGVTWRQCSQHHHRQGRREYLPCRSGNQLPIQYRHRRSWTGPTTRITPHAQPSLTVYTQKGIVVSLQGISKVPPGITIEL